MSTYMIMFQQLCRWKDSISYKEVNKVFLIMWWGEKMKWCAGFDKSLWHIQNGNCNPRLAPSKPFLTQIIIASKITSYLSWHSQRSPFLWGNLWAAREKTQHRRLNSILLKEMGTLLIICACVCVCCAVHYMASCAGNRVKKLHTNLSNPFQRTHGK